jgi:P27 family predicted phage terminase small subunit
MPPEPNWAHYYDDAEKRERAHTNWLEICHALRDAGGLAVSNGHAILRLISLRLEYDFSMQDVAARGVVIPETRKRFAHTNPHFRVMRQIDETIRQLEAELGISPVRRGRIGKIQKRQTKARAADEFLKPANN